MTSLKWHDRFDEHTIGLLRLLSSRSVSFMVVGGAAVAFYECREIHEIDDLDILVDPTIESAEKIVEVATKAASDAGRPLQSIDAKNLAKPKVQFPFKFDPFYAEFLTAKSSDHFSSLFSRSIATRANDFTLKIVSLEDLIVMKAEVADQVQTALDKHANDLVCLRAKLSAKLR
jgi:predicted nucleotidyltransferase